MDAAYANMAAIPDGAAYPARWAARSAALRAEARAAGQLRADIAYGEAARETYDLFAPQGAPRGLIVFVHGGYWRAFDKSVFSYAAQGALQRGWAVATPSYTLAPQARLTRITEEIAAAVAHAAGLIDGPVRLVGHSAGGQIVTRLLCAKSPLSEKIAARVDHVLSVSGLHDLKPLMETAMNGDLQLDEAEAVRESPALQSPRAGLRLTAWVGADELPEFLRQNALIANIWSGLGAQVRCVAETSRHHFNVIDGLGDPAHELTRLLTD
jgi:acetyl esterase/lipase